MKGRRGQVTGIASRAAAIENAIGAGEGYLDPGLVQRSHATVDRALARLELGADHTVVALVGATGSGKSSLFNALAGMDIAEVGARRPMTREPMATMWGDGGDGVLDWLQVSPGRRMRRESVLDADHQAPLHGLILLDLPDHDSTEAIHAVEVDRLVGMVDLLVWVVDPQKYADDALHSRYLQKLTSHAGSMIVVLNQIDKLSPDEAQTCIRDLRRLLDGDGLESVRQLALSARRGDGVDDLRDVLAQVVQEHGAVTERIAAGLQAVTDEINLALGPAQPAGAPSGAAGAEQLVSQLASAAGVPAILDALAAEYRRRGWLRVGWPALTWLRRLRPDALGRLRGSGTVDNDDLRVIATSLMPASTPSQRAEVALAVNAVADASSKGLPPVWATAVHHAVGQPSGQLGAALDDAVAGVSLRLSPPVWWRGVQALHLLFGAAAVAGLVWSLIYGGASLVGAGMQSPSVVGAPLSVVLLAAGLLGGALLAALSGWALVIGASRRRAVAKDRLTGAVESVASDLVLAPIQQVLTVHRETAIALAGGSAAAPPAVAGDGDPDPSDPAGEDPDLDSWQDDTAEDQAHARV
jgi:GTP-binding protein EngB required for normal cell division